jgi:HSP20 family protein
MRYRYVSYRYAVIATGALPPPIVGWRPSGVPLARTRWRPDADVYETPDAVVVIVELAGIDEDDVEVIVFEDALVVEGIRHLRSDEASRYHAASIRQGPFRLEVALPVTVVSDAVKAATYERGMLRIQLRKAMGG